MAPAKRPISIPTFGVLNTVFSLWGLLEHANSILALLTMDKTNLEVLVFSENNDYQRFWLMSTCLGVIVCFALLLSGVGLLLSKEWGRYISLVYAPCALATGLLGIALNALRVVEPALEIDAGSTAVDGLVVGFGSLLFPIALIIFVTRPSVKTYLRQHSGM